MTLAAIGPPSFYAPEIVAAQGMTVFANRLFDWPASATLLHSVDNIVLVGP